MHVLYFSGYALTRPLAWLGLLLNGVGAVNVFIVLSGFVITHLLLIKHEPYRSYIIRRALRIVPIYALCISFALLVLPAQMLMHTHSWVLDRDAWAQRFDTFMPHLWANLLAHLTMFHGVIPDSVLPWSSWQILGPAWSLSLEWQFYLVAPMLLWLLRLNRVTEAVTVFLLLACLSWWQRTWGAEWQQPAVLPLSIHFFLLGILCRLHLPALAKLPPAVVPVIGFAGALLLRPYRYELAFWTLFLTAVLLEVRSASDVTDGNRADGNRWRRVFEWVVANPFVTALGRCSYSTYLVHIPLLALTTWAGANLLGATGQRGNLLVMLITLPLLALLSFTLYRFIEAPFVRLGARYGQHAADVRPTGR
jgi:peptidoglycan/LPS O-acetylase OafA/YrhL